MPSPQSPVSSFLVGSEVELTTVYRKRIEANIKGIQDKSEGKKSEVSAVFVCECYVDSLKLSDKTTRLCRYSHKCSNRLSKLECLPSHMCNQGPKSVNHRTDEVDAASKSSAIARADGPETCSQIRLRQQHARLSHVCRLKCRFYAVMVWRRSSASVYAKPNPDHLINDRDQ